MPIEASSRGASTGRREFTGHTLVTQQRWGSGESCVRRDRIGFKKLMRLSAGG